jgi:hypothetical protein
MKGAEQEQHKTLEIMDGFRFFWGVLWGVLSVIITIGIILVVLYAILFIIGSVG